MQAQWFDSSRLKRCSDQNDGNDICNDEKDGRRVTVIEKRLQERWEGRCDHHMIQCAHIQVHLAHQSRDEHVWEDNGQNFKYSNVEIGPPRDLDPVPAVKEQHSPADVQDNNCIGGKGYTSCTCVKTRRAYTSLHVILCWTLSWVWARLIYTVSVEH